MRAGSLFPIDQRFHLAAKDIKYLQRDVRSFGQAVSNGCSRIEGVGVVLFLFEYV
jgi:hypothetical protein